MIDLVMVLHCHQPVGNFDAIFEKAHHQCYRPILDLLKACPKVGVGLHFSGCLLEWLEQHQPETMDLMADLVARGQVEPLSGGFYEPLLATLPSEDARGQMAMMNEYIEDRFGRKPTGFWLTERIWEPGLPAVLRGTGMEYTIVDDTHFYYAGLKEEDIFGSYVTEKAGHPLKILATPMIMRYLIPFRQVDDVMGHLWHWKESGRTLAVYGDDGEKFGLWPGTYKWVIKEGWLERFFKTVQDCSDWVRAVTPSQHLEGRPPLGRLYLPQASYEEMTEWALPAERGEAMEDMIQVLKNENRWDAWRPFVRGGAWDNFLVKYEESNRIHKKMLRLSNRAAQAIETYRNDPALSAQALEARRLVWRAQCNCAYWHGVFGGLYMGHLRRALHENLALAQGILLEITGRSLNIETLDYDLDGHDEILIDASPLSLGLSPARGGSLFELTYLPDCLNLTDVLTRRHEAYHRHLDQAVVVSGMSEDEVSSIHEVIKAKEPDLKRFLAHDPCRRVSLLDRFFPHEPQAETLSSNQMPETGDFVQGVYEVRRVETVGEDVQVELYREGMVGQNRVGLTKTIRLSAGSKLKVSYGLEGLGGEPAEAVFGSEFNLNLFSDQDEDRYYLAPEYSRRREVYETGAEYGLKRFDLINGGDRIKLSFGFDREMGAAFFPLMTVSMSEDGFEKSYQGSSFLFYRPVRIEPGHRETLTIDLNVMKI